MTVAGAFDRAVDYDRYAIVQAHVARHLADTIAALPIRPDARVLEIGCGTGLLGQALIDRLPGASWLMTDIAPAMVVRTAARFADDRRVAVAVMDGERPESGAIYDLICSSLAMQWFADLPAAVERLRRRLAPGGLLAFATLAAGSFAEWHAAHEGVSAGMHAYPSIAALERLGLAVDDRRYSIAYPDARAFLQALKRIGAGTPRTGHAPLSPSALRGVMARFERMGATATYVVALCTTRAPEAE